MIYRKQYIILHYTTLASHTLRSVRYMLLRDYLISNCVVLPIVFPFSTAAVLLLLVLY